MSTQNLCCDPSQRIALLQVDSISADSGLPAGSDLITLPSGIASGEHGHGQSTIIPCISTASDGVIDPSLKLDIATPVETFIWREDTTEPDSVSLQYDRAAHMIPTSVSCHEDSLWPTSEAFIAMFTEVTPQVRALVQETPHSIDVERTLREKITAFLGQDRLGDETAYTPTPDELNGTESTFMVALNGELSRPTMKELHTALADSGSPSQYFDISEKLSTATRATDTSSGQPYEHTTPSNSQTPTLPPRKKVKFDHRGSLSTAANTPVNYGMVKSASGLIRDASYPHPDDFSEGALIYRVATSPVGRQTPFTFDDHFNLIGAALHDQLVIELNRKLRNGLDLQNRPLIRDLAKCADDNETDQRIIDFTKMGLQTRIGWVLCAEHLDLLRRLDMNKPDLDLEEMDELVRATGVWMFNEWQHKHPGQERGSR